MLLSDEERKKFLEYLENYANSTKLLLEQVDKLKMPQPIKDQITSKHKQEIAACIVIILHLRSAESFSIGGQSHGPPPVTQVP